MFTKDRKEKTMLNKKLKSSLQGTLPSGITFRGDNALWVKRSKSFVLNGEKQERTLTHTVKLGIAPEMTDAEARTQFEKRLAEATKVKHEMINRLASRKFLEMEQPIKNADSSLAGLFENMLGTVYRNVSAKHLSLVKQYYTDTINFFAERENKNPTVGDLHSSEWTLVEFKDWCRKQIELRPMNMYGTSNTNSVNKRLGVWRQLTAYAIKKRLLSRSDCLDAGAKNFGIYDDPRDQSKPKNPLSIADEDKLLQMMDDNNDQFWSDCFTVAIDTGVRHDNELNALCPEWVNFSTRKLEFKRPKTGNWSSIPLTARAYEILKRLRPVALKDEKNRFFPVSKSSIRHTWNKYMKLCGFVQNVKDKNGREQVKTLYQPYSTRHTFITRLVEAEVQPKQVMDLAGHTCIETTMSFYTHSTDDLLESAITKLENYKDKKRKQNKPAEAKSMIGHNSRKVLKK